MQAGSKVSALLGRMSFAVGYQPTLSNLCTYYNLTKPTPATAFTHLDATTYYQEG